MEIDKDTGEIHVFLNVCSHRGMQVCRSECGNSSSFKCSYHGWVFGNDGNLLGAPFEKEMYGESWDEISAQVGGTADARRMQLARAANRLGWQWTVGALTGKPYGFSRWQVEKRAPGVCAGCELRRACPVQQWPDEEPLAPELADVFADGDDEPIDLA